MTYQPLEGPTLKIRRAQAKIPDLRERIFSFLEANPGEIFTDVGPASGEECFKVRAIPEPPAEIAAICGEIIYGFRSALDQLACALATQNGYSDVSGTYFPIAGSKDEFESGSTRKKISKLSQDAVSIMDSLKPYKGGNDLLWALNKLANTDKHQILIPMAAANFGGELQLTGNPLGTVEHTFRAPKAWKPLDTDAIVFIYPAGMKFDGEITVLRDVCFKTPAAVSGRSVITTLEQFAGLTEEIVSVFETKFFQSAL